MTGLRNLDLNLLVVFEGIYSSGNISHAAKKLGVSQPTISNALARLRETLDDPLFVRAGRGVQPTPKAVRMIGPVRDALRMIENGVAEETDFDPSTHRRHFRMVLLDPVEPIVMPPLLREIQQYRNITIETHHIMVTPLIDGLNDGSLDLVMSNFLAEIDDATCEVIGPVNLAMVARRDHPAIGDQFTLDHFRSLGHMALVPRMRAMSRLEEGLRRMNLERHVVYSVTKFWSFPHILANSDLVAILPREFATVAAQVYPLALYPLPFELPEEKIYLTWKNQRTGDPAHRWFRERIADAYAKALVQGDPARLADK